MNVNKYYWAAQKRKEKLTAEMTSMIIARFPSLILAYVLVLDHADFTVLLYFVSVNRLLPVHGPDTTGAHYTPTRSQRQILCRHFCYISFTVTAPIQKYIFPVSEYNAFIDCTRQLYRIRLSESGGW